MELYLSPKGNDSWSGTLPEPNTEGNNGPLATIAGARKMIHELKAKGLLSGELPISMRGGRYHVESPVVFGSGDTTPVCFRAYPGEAPVIDGGRRITGWEETNLNGVKAWVTTIPEVAAGQWCFKQLFVDGTRRNRPRLPREGFHRIEDVPSLDQNAYIFSNNDSFVVEEGHVNADWKNLTDVEVVVLHFWIEERMPIASFDPETRTVTSSRVSQMNLKDEKEGWAKYYVDNVFEAMTEPGDWYLDRADGRLYYVPMEGETPDSVEVYAPVAERLLELTGDPDTNRFVENVRFDGIAFEHTIWNPSDPVKAGSSQSANTTPAAIRLEGAHNCSFENCTIAHTGAYGIEVAEGCRSIRIVGCEITDNGAGCVHIHGANALGPEVRRTGGVRITDSHLHDGGRVFHSGVGILCRDAFGCTLSHNDIHDFYYSGISCGWVWGYRESVSKNNHIEHNHIHDLGKGWLSDMGGIYTLGVQPGTVIRGNLIHGVTMAGYGGWAIYPDEGSSHIIIENNIGYDTSSQGFHQHYGRENIIRNNIFAFGREGMMRRTRLEDHNSFTFEKNIIVSDGEPMWYGDTLEKGGMITDFNVFWDISGDLKLARDLSNDEWLALGYDNNTVIADPGLADPKNANFTLADDSPARKMGFKPIDMSGVGPRPVEERD